MSRRIFHGAVFFRGTRKNLSRYTNLDRPHPLTRLPPFEHRSACLACFCASDSKKRTKRLELKRFEISQLRTFRLHSYLRHISVQSRQTRTKHDPHNTFPCVSAKTGVRAFTIEFNGDASTSTDGPCLWPLVKCVARKRTSKNPFATALSGKVGSGRSGRAG